VLVALFRGQFDHGTFAVKSVEWAKPAQAVIVAERSDHEAMNSDQYFVFVSSHVPTPRELRSELYSDRPVFSTSNPCVTARWRDPSHLIVSCREGLISSSEINSQRDRAGNIRIEYEAISSR
jgi:hypothetical protein